jgi:hypothetical protein
MEVPGRRFLPVAGIRVDVDTTYSYDNVGKITGSGILFDVEAFNAG